MNPITEFKNDLSGLATVVEMFGEGHAPVAPAKANDRAAVCAGCPKNQPGNWWDGIKTRAADTVRRHLEMKNHLQLRTDFDDKLHVCQVCSCVLQLKPHVPAETIKNHTDPEMIPNFPAWCWVRIELESL